MENKSEKTAYGEFCCRSCVAFLQADTTSLCVYLGQDVTIRCNGEFDVTTFTGDELGGFSTAISLHPFTTCSHDFGAVHDVQIVQIGHGSARRVLL